MSEVKVDRLSKRFGSVSALADVSIDVEKGEVIALLGPSGCGKTTLLRCIAGLEQPSDGLIQVGGETLFSPQIFIPPARRNIAMVFQSYALWPHMNVWENVSYGLRIQKFPKDLINDRVDGALALLGLSHLRDRFPSQMSGGQQQRVAVARALALRADLVLFDEPLSNLDLRMRESVRVELRRVLKKLGQTAVYVTHDIGEAVVVADRIVMMDHGSIVQIGTPEQTYHAPRNKYVAEFVGNTNCFQAHVDRSTSVARLIVNEVMSFSVDQLSCIVPADANTVTLMIRPEYIEVHTGARDGIEAQIRDVEFVGQTTALSLSLGGMMVQAITLSRPDIQLSVGDHCRISIADKNVIVLPE